MDINQNVKNSEIMSPMCGDYHHLMLFYLNILSSEIIIIWQWIFQIEIAKGRCFHYIFFSQFLLIFNNFIEFMTLFGINPRI